MAQPSQSNPASGSQRSINTLHDVIVNYVTTAAYTSTARILAQSTPAANRTQQPVASGSSTGPKRDGEHGALMDVDVDVNPAGSSSRREKCGVEGSGEGEGMDIDEGDDEGSDGSDDDAGLGERQSIRKKEKRKRPQDGTDPESDERSEYELLGREELDSIDKRRAIINHILNGSIARAVEALTAHFPSVLLDPSSSSLNSSSSSNGHSHSNGHSSSFTPTQHFYSPYAPITPASSTSASSSSIYSHSASRPNFSSPAGNHNIPVLHRSTYPSHVRLNLQIQQFIESFRQLSSSSSTNGSSPGPSSPSSSIGSLGNSGTLSNSNSSINLTHALTAAQGLHAEAKKLPAEVRAVYLQEIKDVGALFAYADPENSILGGFLDQSRRIKLSEQVNAAILRSEGKSTQSTLESFARRTVLMYNLMAQHNVDPRPPWSLADGPGKAKLAEYWKHQIASGKPFDLHEYIQSQW
ncbi:hypothetical protein IAT40_006313 [Kwoniella sp. CBS 6097]